MGTFEVLIFGFLIYSTNALKCANISGTWQNELGSRMLLKVGESNRFAGEYYTAVETTPGAAAFISNITGSYSPQGDGTLLAFSVLFNHGSSMASWVGQCTVCDGKEVIHTTYIFRKYAPNDYEKWATVIVNQNTFYRLEYGTENEIASSGAMAYSPVKTSSVVSKRHPGGLELAGKWKSNGGEEIEISGMNGNVLTGKHHSTDLIGNKDGNNLFTAVTLISKTNKRIKSWTGYIYDSPSNIPSVLEASWLEHEFSSSCVTPRNSVRFGKQRFARAVAEIENSYYKSETFLDKIRKFFSSMF